VRAQSGSTTLTLTDAIAFPDSGAVVAERDTPGQRELIPYASKAGNVLTLVDPTTSDHPATTSIVLSTVGFDRVFPAESMVSVPATDNVARIDFLTRAAATLRDGDVVSEEVTAVAVLPGATPNVGTAQVTTLVNPPFPTATVTNDAPMQGGRDEETDSEYRQRIKQTIQALSNGTANDLLVAATRVALPNGQRVISAQVVEEFADPDVSVYVDDGTGAVTTTASQAALELLIHRAEPGQRRARLRHWPVVSGTLSLKRSAVRGTIDLVTVTGGTALCSDAGAGLTTAALVGLTVIDDNRNAYSITANTQNDFAVTVPPAYPAPVPGPYAVLPATFLATGTDFVFNETTGDLELTSGLQRDDVLAAVPNPVNAYTYYTGLIQQAQRVLNGDPDDLDRFPGVKAAGIKLKVRAPVVQNISFSITIISTFGTIETELIAQVKEVVQRYVNGLGVGDDVILAEVVAAVMSVPGVTDTRVNSPASNVILLDGVLPRTRASLITVL
jgi:hypothetical protein